MAIAHDATTTHASGAGGEGTSTFSHTVSGSDRLLIVATGNTTDESVTGITYNGVALTQVTGADVANGTSARTDLWYLVAPATGANDVVVSWSGVSRNGCVASSYTGADQTSPVGTSATEIGISGDPSLGVSSATGELVYDIVGQLDGDGETFTVGTGQTKRADFVGASGEANRNIRVGASEEAGAATVTMDWTLSGGTEWAHSAVPLKPASGGGGGLSIPIVMHHLRQQG